MKKLILLVFALLLLFAGRCHASINTLGYTTEVNTAWTSMMNANHSWYQYLTYHRTHAQNEDRGIMAAISWKLTGDSSYATTAWGFWSGWAGRTYNPSGSVPDRNKSRDYFVMGSTVYSIICGGVSPGLDATNCANFKDILNYWTDRAQNNYVSGPAFNVQIGTRCSNDSDETLGQYFGATLFALAIANDDPTRSSAILNYSGDTNPEGPVSTWGGLTSTGTDKTTCRNAINSMFSGIGASEWIESEYYNLGTNSYWLLGYYAINNYYGTDKFPEITAALTAYGNHAYNQLVPGYNNIYSWGDDQNANSIKDYTHLPMLQNISRVTANQKACYVLNSKYGTLSTTSRSDYWLLLANPYCTQSAPSGVTYQNTSLGNTYWHSGWSTNDTAFFSSAKPETGVDHDSSAFTNFNLWRQGNWAFTHIKLYYGDQHSEGQYQNGLRVSGAYPTVWMEARGQALHEEGNDYAYQVGVTGGNAMYSNYYDPPPESVHEYTHSIFFKHHSDGSDTIITFDRINAENPQSLSKFARVYSTTKNQILYTASRHTFIMRAPVLPTKTGDDISWTADNGETVNWHIYTDSAYTYEAHNQATAWDFPPVGGSTSEKKYRLVAMLTDTTTQHQTVGNIYHAGSTLTSSQFTQTSGEATKGYIFTSGTDRNIILFNAANRTSDLPTPTPNNGSNEVQDPNKFNQLKYLHYHKTNFTVTPTTTGTSTLYVMDLNPSLTWHLNIDGAGANVIIPTSQGVYYVTLPGSGSHTLAFTVTTPTCSEDWTLCSTQNTCETSGWCWEDSTCKQFCTPSTCDDQCSICSDQSSCNASTVAGGCHWWSGGTCNSQVEGTKVPLIEIGGCSITNFQH